MEQNNIIFSIIIPHKNIPQLLQRCLDSIPARDDVQIIVIDDNSDLDKVDFESFPGLNKKNTEVYFTKEGKGAGYARNIGLQHAKGKWLIFADADDFFMPCLNDVMDKYRNDESDVIYFKTISVDSETLTLSPRRTSIRRNNLLNNIKKTNNQDLFLIIEVPWGKLVKHDIIIKSNIVFQEVRYSNDVFFSAHLAAVASHQSIDERELYCVTNTPNSLTKNLSVESLLIRYGVAIDTFVLLKKFGKEKIVSEKMFNWLRGIFTRKPALAFSLLPNLIRKIGIFYFVKGTYNSLLYLIIKNKWEKQ